MKSKNLLCFCIIISLLAIGCTKNPRPSTRAMEADMARASGGLFGKCMEHLDSAADLLSDAQDSHQMIVNAKNSRKADWYYKRGESLASNAAQQRAIAEQVCKEFIALELNIKNPREITFLKGQVHFGMGSTQLSKSEMAKLKSVIASLEEKPASQVMLVGHTDTTGTRQFNQALSTKRAAAVFDELKQLASGSKISLPPKRIELVGSGQVDGPDNKASRENRRVDIYLVPAPGSRG